VEAMADEQEFEEVAKGNYERVVEAMGAKAGS